MKTRTAKPLTELRLDCRPDFWKSAHLCYRCLCVWKRSGVGIGRTESRGRRMGEAPQINDGGLCTSRRCVRRADKPQPREENTQLPYVIQTRGFGPGSCSAAAPSTSGESLDISSRSNAELRQWTTAQLKTAVSIVYGYCIWILICQERQQIQEKEGKKHTHT